MKDFHVFELERDKNKFFASKVNHLLTIIVGTIAKSFYTAPKIRFYF